MPPWEPILFLFVFLLVSVPRVDRTVYIGRLAVPFDRTPLSAALHRLTIKCASVNTLLSAGILCEISVCALEWVHLTWRRRKAVRRHAPRRRRFLELYEAWCQGRQSQTKSKCPMRALLSVPKVRWVDHLAHPAFSQLRESLLIYAQFYWRGQIYCCGRPRFSGWNRDDVTMIQEGYPILARSYISLRKVSLGVTCLASILIRSVVAWCYLLAEFSCQSVTLSGI